MSKPPLITQFKIEGFKSFGTPFQQLQLGPLNFLVGANASGKTNLISALRFLRDAVNQNVEYAVSEFGGLAEVRNKIARERKTPKPLMMSVHIEMGDPIPDNRQLRIRSFEYEVKLDLRNKSGQPEIDSETMVAQLLLENSTTAEYRLHRTQQQVEIHDPSTAENYTFQVPKQESSRLALNVGFMSLPAVILRNLIEGWRFYNVSPLLARVPFKETPDVDLGPAGENLSVILHKLEQQNGNGALDSIVSGLKSAVPGFSDIKTTQLPVEGKWAFQVHEEKIGAINPDSVSDGTIRLLTLMTIAHWTAQHASLVAIEEPENGLHPHLSEYIVQILRTAAENTQLLVTTHNPSFLDYLEPEEVILCDKIDGYTKMRTASDVADVDSFRKHFRLGELWVQGTLGGVP